MNASLVRWLVIPGITLLLFSGGQYFRRKVVKPSYQNEIQTPGKVDNYLLMFIRVLTFIPLTLMLLGFITKETEMAIVNAILTLIFIGINLFLKREYAMSYQETEDFLSLKREGKKYKYSMMLLWIGDRE